MTSLAWTLAFSLAPLGLWVTPHFLLASGWVRLETPASSILSVENGWDQEAAGEVTGGRNVASGEEQGASVLLGLLTAI